MTNHPSLKQLMQKSSKLNLSEKIGKDGKDGKDDSCINAKLPWQAITLS